MWSQKEQIGTDTEKLQMYGKESREIADIETLLLIVKYKNCEVRNRKGVEKQNRRKCILAHIVAQVCNAILFQLCQ